MPLDAAMIIHSRNPLNAEPPLDQLARTFRTPQSLLYVRSHGAIPQADDRLDVNGLAARPLALRLAELQRRFTPATITATLQCAGNRRADLQAVHPTSGDKWAPGAIGTADWTGVRLADLLDDCGVQPGAAHVALVGRDHLATEPAIRYAVSIPLAKAMMPEVLLCWAMNGEDLAPEHGAPLRAVVPGYAGVRSTKWLGQIELRADPADCPIQRQDYKLLPPGVTPETADWDTALTINGLPVNSAICPPPGAVAAGACPVQGWAVASGRMVARVDVSADGGQTWQQAALQQEGCWSWTLWHTVLDLPPGRHVLVVRAWDEAGQTQPDNPACVWNCKGYLSAAWHRVPVTAI